MKIFEFAFNPKKRRDRFFEVFSYEPKNSLEKPKGSLYIVGELNNSLKGAAPALKAALKMANHFLAQESKKGNVDWLGNLHLAVLLFITVKEKKTMFYLTKTGSIKISMMRHGIIVDVGKNLESSSRQPGKVFENLVSGALVPNDSVAAISKEIFDILSREKSLGGIGTLREAKQFREFFSKRNRMLSLSSGVLVSFVIEQEEAKRSPINKSLFPSFLKPKLMLKKGLKIPIPKFKFKPPWLRHQSLFKKQVILVLLFLAMLLLGSLFF